MKGALINILSFDHPHAESIFKEGLWGFPDNQTNQNRWKKLEKGDKCFLYGEFKGVKGIWILCEIVGKTENRNPVSYWVQNPTGYPWQIRIKPIFPIMQFNRQALESIDPIRRDELELAGLRIFKQKTDRWSLILMAEGEKYDYSCFEKLVQDFKTRNEKFKPEKPDHEAVKRIIYQIGQIQNRFPEMEYPMENKRVDVVWRRIPKGDPCVAFEIQFSGNLFEALTKLKHCFDFWNSIPVLVTTKEQIKEARRWIEGSFHELRNIFRVLTWEEILEFYNVKQKSKEFERKLGLF